MNEKQRVILVILTTGGLMGACSSPQYSRIDRNRDAYETWPLETRQAVLDGKVEHGMTQEMVKTSWGKPTEVVARSNGPHRDEIWIYRTTTGGEYYDPNPMGQIGGGYPSRSMGRGMGGNTGGIGIGTGGLSVGTGGMGSAPIMIVPPTTTEKEVVFRDGVVIRADG